MSVDVQCLKVHDPFASAKHGPLSSDVVAEAEPT